MYNKKLRRIEDVLLSILTTSQLLWYETINVGIEHHHRVNLLIASI